MQNILDHFDTDDQTLNEWRLFIGPDADYYIDSWLQIRHGQFFNFNIYAFVFSIFWMLYRQMFKATILYLSIFFAEGYLEKIIFYSTNFIHLPDWWFSIRIFIFSLILGFTGNWIYLLHTESSISEIKKKYIGENQDKIIKLRGGTSIIPVVLFVVILLLSVMVNYFYQDLGLNANTMIR